MRPSGYAVSSLTMSSPPSRSGEFWLIHHDGFPFVLLCCGSLLSRHMRLFEKRALTAPQSADPGPVTFLGKSLRAVRSGLQTRYRLRLAFYDRVLLGSAEPEGLFAIRANRQDLKKAQRPKGPKSVLMPTKAFVYRARDKRKDGSSLHPDLRGQNKKATQSGGSNPLRPSWPSRLDGSQQKFLNCV